MSFFRSACVALTLFAMAGVSEGFAKGKLPKAKITRQPASATVTLGDYVELKVAFNSASEATLQWRRNKQPIEDATDSSYVINTVLPEDAGSYDVVIKNAGGSLTSKAAKLTVSIAPSSLPIDSAIFANLTYRVNKQTIAEDGSFVVTGGNTLQDPENPSDSFTFTYKRLPKDRATLVIRGSFYDAELHDTIQVLETHTLKFTGLSDEGELVATTVTKGAFTLPKGYKPSKIAFTGKGTISIEVAQVQSFGGGTSGGTLMIGGGNTYQGSGSISQAGTLVFNGINEMSPGLGGLVLNTGTLSLGGSSIYSGSITKVGSGSFTMNASTVTLASVDGLAASGSTGTINLTIGSNMMVNFLPSVSYGGSLTFSGGSFSGTAASLTIDSTPLDFFTFMELPTGSFDLSGQYTGGFSLQPIGVGEDGSVIWTIVE